MFFKTQRVGANYLAIVLVLPAIMHGMSAPIGMVVFPTVKVAYYDRRSYNPGPTAPVNILPVAGAYIFITVPHVIIRGVGCINWRR